MAPAVVLVVLAPRLVVAAKPAAKRRTWSTRSSPRSTTTRKTRNPPDHGARRTVLAHRPHTAPPGPTPGVFVSGGEGKQTSAGRSCRGGFETRPHIKITLEQPF